MKVIGITGGIGSGKSVVTQILQEKYNAYAANTDQIARDQMEPGGVSYRGVVEHFGTGILTESGEIDRSILAGIIFQNPAEREKINQLTHPNVLLEVKSQIEAEKIRGIHPYFLVETALMIESRYDRICDCVWYIHAPEDIRRERLRTSRGYSDEKINGIFGNQRKEEEFRRHFPIVIYNNGDLDELNRRIELALQRIESCPLS